MKQNNMNLNIFWLSIWLLFIPQISVGQEIDDFKFVTSKIDLIMRNEPNTNGSIIGKCESGSKLRIQSVERLDTIEMRISNWLKISNEKLVSGFVFGGFLNSSEIPSNQEIESFWSITEILNYLISKYDPDLISSYKKVTSRDKEHLDITIWNNDEISVYDKSGYEWGETEYVLKGWKLYELINLIELCNWFGNNYEYENLKSSIGLDKRSFKYKTGHSDSERNVYIEEGRNSVRISINESL